MATYTENYVLEKPTYAELADVAVLNRNMDKVDDVMHASQVSLAPAYEESETYNTDDVVMYEMLMYKCLEDNVTGAWDGTKWERTTASECGGGGSIDFDIFGEGSGATVTITDGAEAGLAECIAEIEATQSGSGTPSPSNVRPIVGRSEVNITVSDGETDNITTIPLGRTVYGGTLDVTRGVLTVDRGYVEFDGSGDEDWRTVVEGYLRDFYINIPLAKSFCELICNIAERDGDGQTPNNIFISTTKNFNWYIGNTIGIDNVADFKTWLSNNPLQLVYELATPQTYTLTPEEVSTILGYNNISADSGDVSVVYVKQTAPIKPNPTGADIPLKGIEIDGEKFKIESGGYHKALLWDSGSPITGASYTTDYALLDNLSNYNQIILMVSNNIDRADVNHQYSQQIWLDVEYLLSSEAWHKANITGFGSRYFDVSFTDSSFRIIQGDGEDGHLPTVFQIYGVRY